MRLRCVCKCGGENYVRGDWTAHWKYGEKKPGKFLNRHPKLRAVYYFLFTEISIVR